MMFGRPGGSKGSLYEGGHRVPFIVTVRMHGVTPPTRFNAIIGSLFVTPPTRFSQSLKLGQYKSSFFMGNSPVSLHFQWKIPKGILVSSPVQCQFCAQGPGVPAGRVDHSLIAAVDWFVLCLHPLLKIY